MSTSRRDRKFPVMRCEENFAGRPTAERKAERSKPYPIDSFYLCGLPFGMRFAWFSRREEQ